jgi:hypothetical protein
MDEEQISTLRAALHNWIDHATVEQLERMNQVVAADARRFVPVTMFPEEEREAPKMIRYEVKRFSAEEFNKQNVRRREHADWLVQRSRFMLLKPTPEQVIEWDAANPDPALDDSEE